MSDSKRMLSLMLKVGATAGVVKLMVDNSAVILGDETATSECGGRSCIRLGAEGKLIQEINIRLAGFGGNVPTTNFTARTANMIRQFQRDYMEIQPTGRICGDTLKAIDEFGDNYTFTWDELKCTCGVCDGFGRGLDSDEKQDASIAERSRKYEYPGIHRSLLWGFKASMFYLTKKEGGIFSVNKISSGYRCQENNRQRGRSSTNHMGKAIDIHYNKNGTRTRSTPDIEKVRSEIFNKCLGAKWDWKAEKNIFYLESTRVGATTWVHVDVREFELPYLKDEFFAKTEAVMNGQKIVDLANAEGYAETCACMGDYASQDGATTDAGERVDPNTLSFSDDGIEFLKGWESEVKEGGKHVLYDDDSGYCTIGWGHLVSGRRSCDSISNIPQNFKDGLTDAQAKALMLADLATTEASVKSNVSVNLYQHEYDALVSFVFNIGGQAFADSTMLKKLNESKYDEVPAEFPRWNKSGGVVMGGLTTRRNRERDIFTDGVYDSTH